MLGFQAVNLLTVGAHVIDSEGYRPNVGIILCNAQGRLLWARRIGQRSWQFPQGGIRPDESPEQAMFRELAEEIGLQPEHVEVVGCTKGWLRYRLPPRFIRRNSKPMCIGQKQVWYLLRMVGEETDVRLDLSERPEFDHWRWVDYWYPLRAVVSFKRQVYQCALRELAPLLFAADPRPREPASRSPERRPPPSRGGCPDSRPAARNGSAYGGGYRSGNNHRQQTARRTGLAVSKDLPQPAGRSSGLAAKGTQK